MKILKINTHQHLAGKAHIVTLLYANKQVCLFSVLKYCGLCTWYPYWHVPGAHTCKIECLLQFKTDTWKSLRKERACSHPITLSHSLGKLESTKTQSLLWSWGFHNSNFLFLQMQGLGQLGCLERLRQHAHVTLEKRRVENEASIWGRCCCIQTALV